MEADVESPAGLNEPARIKPGQLRNIDGHEIETALAQPSGHLRLEPGMMAEFDRQPVAGKLAGQRLYPSASLSNVVACLGKLAEKSQEATAVAQLIHRHAKRADIFGVLIMTQSPR